VRLKSLCMLPVALLLAACPLSRPSATASVLGTPEVIPFELRGDVIMVRVNVNGHPAVLGLDTGSSVSVIDSAFAADVGLSMKGGAVPITGAGTATARLGIARSLSMGRAQLGNLLMAATSAFDDARSRMGRDVHGTLGFDLFDKYVVAIDYAAHTMTLSDPGAFTYAGRGIVLPIRLPNRAPVIDAQVVTRKSGTIAAHLTLDLGSTSYALRLSSPFVAAHDLTHDTVTVAGPFGLGLGGLVEGQLLRMPQLRLGSLVVDRLSTGLFTGTEGAMGRKALTDGTVGVPVWRRTRLVIDYARNRVIVEPQGRFDLADTVDASGITLLVAEKPTRVLRVALVVKGSAGALAGVQVGDQLESIDGHAAASMSYDEIRELLRAAGTARTLTLRRAGSPVEARVLLKEVF
jgi:hypothetical protein